MYNIFWQNTNISCKLLFYLHHYLFNQQHLFTTIYVIILNKYKFEQFIVTDKIIERKSVQYITVQKMQTCK